MDVPDTADSGALLHPHASGEWVAQCLSELMARHGVHSRQQATLVAQLCQLSISQARRKLKGAVWTFDEVTALCRHFGQGLDAVFATPVFLPGSGGVDPSGVAHGGQAAHTTSASYPATLYLDDVELDCEVRLGALRTQGGSPALLATLHPIRGWMVGSTTRLAKESAHSPRYDVDQLHMRVPEEPPLARIAVLDDDRGSADALADWFNELGYQADSYQSAEALLDTPGVSHDAYVVDLILAGGQTSQALVQRIRSEQPEAPIILLTGQLRDGTASEATLATILRTQGVTFFEKPVRPAVLTAAIQSSLDRVTKRHAA
jgi:CheY-like chemotaxis protein